jgi:hypothetical protein
MQSVPTTFVRCQLSLAYNLVVGFRFWAYSFVGFVCWTVLISFSNNMVMNLQFFYCAPSRIILGSWPLHPFYTEHNAVLACILCIRLFRKDSDNITGPVSSMSKTKAWHLLSQLQESFIKSDYCCSVLF